MDAKLCPAWVDDPESGLPDTYPTGTPSPNCPGTKPIPNRSPAELVEAKETPAPGPNDEGPMIAKS